jgi:hypothetical protein
MTRNKKILMGAGGVFGTLLVALVVLPFFFIDQIEARVRADVERATKVRISWSDIGLTFFRDFPHPTLTLSGLEVLGTGRFEGDTLATVRDFRLALNGRSMLGAVRGTSPLVIRSIRIDEPRLRLEVNEDGIASWSVLPEGESSSGGEAGGGIAVTLQSFELTNGDILLDNAQSGLFVSVEGLRHSLDGDFSRESLVASTRSHSDAVTVRFAGTPYLSGVSLDLDADFDVDMTAQRAQLTDNELRLNDLVVRLDGDVAREGENLEMNLTFEAPSTAFGQVLSLLPAVYAQDFASLETSGTFSLTGSVKGAYGADAFPAFAINLEVVDGRFRYPDLPLSAQAIGADLSITNPGGDIDSTVVDLSRFHVEIDDQPLDASATLRTPVSDPDAELRVDGTIDLGDLARTVKLENAEGLGGVIVADADVRARRSDVENERYDRIAAQGAIEARDVSLRSEGLRQPIDIQRARIELTPQTAHLRALQAQLGSSDVQATGRLDNLLGFALGQETLSGVASFTSNRFDLDEWKSENELEAIPVPAMLDLTLDGTIDELVYNGLEMTNARGRGIVRDQRLTLDGATLETLGGRVSMDGYYETLDPVRPTFALDLGLDSLDVAGASAAFLTVRMLAPVAQYARGTFSTQLGLSGALGQNMAPDFEVLDGEGSLSTSRVAIEGFPMLDRLKEALQLERFSNPTVEAVRSNIHIEDGRLRIDPFQVGVGGVAMNVSGSNGIDQSVDYTLGLQLPRTGLADAALSRLASSAGALGVNLAAIDPIPVSVRVTGTIMQPSLDLGLSQASGSLQGAVTGAAGAAVTQRIDEAQQRADASAAEARERARAQADSIVAEAQRQADAIRAEASRAAAEVRAQGDQAADDVLARATNPLARAAAQPAAERIRQEAQTRAEAIEREADEQATALVAEAQARADALLGG